MGNSFEKHFVIENQIEELTSLAEEIDELASDWGLSAKLAMNMNLALEEALSNIIFYAFSDNKKHKIKISVFLNINKLKIVIMDDGSPFNPLSQDKPDITLQAEDRPIGGLGIFLISKMMDEMNYTRKDNQNVLSLYKSI